MHAMVVRTGRRTQVGVWYGLFLLALLWCQGVEARDGSQSNDLIVKPVKQRISDEAIEADKQVFRQLRATLDVAKSRGRFRTGLCARES